MSVSENTKYNCPKCNKLFTNNYTLNRHLNKKFSCSLDNTQCIKCARFFYDTSTRIRHERTCKIEPEINQDS